jgi:predicted DNA-binding transcriptional regulator AlpA
MRILGSASVANAARCVTLRSGPVASVIAHSATTYGVRDTLNDGLLACTETSPGCLGFTDTRGGGMTVERNKKRLLNVRETADYLGLAPRTIYNGIAPKAERPFPVKPKRWGRKVLFDLADLDAYVDGLSTDGV